LLRFIFALFATTGVIVGILLLSLQLGWLQVKPSFAWPTLILLFTTTVLIYGYLHNANASGFFTQFYLLSMAIKLLAYSSYNLVIVLKDKPGAVPNVVFFMAVYFVFTVCEIVFLYHRITGKSKM
jgi:hypothetical protein